MKLDAVLREILDLIGDALTTPPSAAVIQEAIAKEFDKKVETLTDASPELVAKLEALKAQAASATVPATPAPSPEVPVPAVVDEPATVDLSIPEGDGTVTPEG